MKLFENCDRNYLGPANNNESSYNFYNRSARKEIFTIRETLESWFGKIPEKDKHAMKCSFQKSFDDTFYELFLFSLFAALGFEIEIHPKVPNSTKHPDFLIRKGDMEIYVEAKIAKDKTDQQESVEKMRNTFYDTINKTNSDQFMLVVEKLDFISGKQPKANKIVKFIENALSTLDQDEIEKRMKENGLRAEQIIYSDVDVYAIFNPVPLIPSAKFENNRRAIGMYEMETFWGGGEEIIRNSFHLKAKRYGNLEKPFMICINALSKRTSGRIDIDSAVWGSKVLPLRDGVFADSTGGKRNNVSAVMVNQIYLHGIPNSKYLLYENPFAEHLINFEKLGLKYNHIVAKTFVEFDGDDLDTILNIDKNWLS